MTGAEYKAGDATPCLGLSMDFEFCLSVVGLVLCLCLCFMFCVFFLIVNIQLNWIYFIEWAGR